MPRSLPLLVFLAMLLAGCGQSKSEEAPETSQGRTVTDPSDYSYLDEEGERARPHAHDYWDGQQTQVLFDRHWTSLGTSPCAPVYPERGQLVNPGTGNLTITLTWDAPENPAMWVRLVEKSLLKSDRMWGTHDVLNGVPLIVDVPTAFEDVGHSPRSHLSVLLCPETTARSQGGPGSGAFTNLRAHATIDRQPGPLPLERPHPDHWNGNRTLLLWSRQEPKFEPDGPLGSHAVGMQIVPPQTGRLRVAIYLNSSSDTSGTPEPSLTWHGADRYGGPDDEERVDMPPTAVDPVAGADHHIEWFLDVEPRMWDSPYWNQTGWRFWPHLGGEFQIGSASYHYFIEARRLDA